MKNFILIGLGYIAQRHLEAIKSVGGNLLAVLTKNDSAGILDSYFPNCEFFMHGYELDLWVKKTKPAIDYVVVCSPNNYHITHCRWALMIGADVICEKPLCLNVNEAKELQNLEIKHGHTVWNIMQLRLHSTIPGLINRKGSVDLSYTVKRGSWYFKSWKGDELKSGGIESNIGIHFLDMLLYVFGKPESLEVIKRSNRFSSGILKLERAHVNYILQISDHNNRSLKLNGEEVNFNEGFTNLHNESYLQILAGNGFKIDDVLPALELIEQIRNYKL